MSSDGAVRNGVQERTDWGVPYNYVGIVMQRTPEGEACGRVASRTPGVEIIEGATFLDIRGKDRLRIDFDEVSEEVGHEVDGYSLQAHMATLYGRMVHEDDAFVLVADPREVDTL